MKELRFAILGAGFWASYQLAAWQELAGVKCVGICDPVFEKAQKLAELRKVPSIYSNPEDLFLKEDLDFVDIIASVEAHQPLVALAVEHGIPAICQKPLGRTLNEARAMVETCRAAGVPLYVHENWRWQAPLRELKHVLASGRLGTLVRARIDYANSFPVFNNQPFLKELNQFILTDIGTHILDAARFLFGEASELYCQTRRIHADIKGEDVATVIMRMQDGLTVTCNMSYASKWEFDRFPETFVAIEGTKGGVSLGHDFTIKFFGDVGNMTNKVELPHYDWADPAYALIHTSIVECNRNLLSALRGEGKAETTGADNLKTLELVFGAYDSAERAEVIKFSYG